MDDLPSPADSFTEAEGGDEAQPAEEAAAEEEDTTEISDIELQPEEIERQKQQMELQKALSDAESEFFTTGKSDMSEVEELDEGAA